MHSDTPEYSDPGDGERRTHAPSPAPVTQEPSTPPNPEPIEDETADDLPPKPDPEPVQPVQDEELARLEEEGERDVDEQSPEEAEEDETVDNEENDSPEEG